AFGTAPAEAPPEMDGLDTGPRRQKVSELRDYSSRLWRGSDPGLPPSAALRDIPDVPAATPRGAAAAAAEERELALLTGRKRAPPVTSSDPLAGMLMGLGQSGEKEKKEKEKGKKEKDKKSKGKKHKKDKEKKKKHKKEKKAKSSSS
ncbi:unnamed protein product, partial [Cladocopium goreaui]